MPLIVTDADVLAQIAIDDGAAAAIDAEITTIPGVPPATLAAWRARLAAYRAWRAIAQPDLSGGFLGGAWFGVPELGNQAVAFAIEFRAWQDMLNAIAAGRSPGMVAPPIVDPLTVANENADLTAAVSLDTGSKVLVGAALAVLLLFLVRR